MFTSAAESANNVARSPLTRRRTIGAAAAATFALMSPALIRPALAAGKSSAAHAPRIATPESEWLVFCRRFLSADGRVIDTGNGGVSHSEGQGIGMLCAAQFGTQDAFDLLHHWTTQNLRRPTDALHAWRYRPGVADPVDDPNNATDGDLLIGLALFTAADRWNNADYRIAGSKIAKAVLSMLVQRTAAGVVLLPGLQGFEKHDGVVVNPSYYMLPAIRRFATEVPDPIWAALWNDGLKMLRSARFGRWGLPPDWLTVSRAGDLSTSGDWPARYSFDAVRVPLYMCWAGLSNEPAVIGAHSFWSERGPSAPAWTDLTSNAVAPYALTSGMEAIRRYVEATVGRRGAKADLPQVAQATDYYSAALVMLTHAASSSSGDSIS